MKLSETLTIELDNEQEYEITCAYFSPPVASSWHDPGDGGECNPGPFVKNITTNEVITYDTFLMDYAIESKLTLDKADQRITDMLFEAVLEEYSERLNDGPEYDRDDDNGPWSGGFCDNH